MCTTPPTTHHGARADAQPEDTRAAVSPLSRHAPDGPTAADWVIREAVPRFLRLAGFDDEAAWFAALPPYCGHSATGDVRCWRGIGTRALDIHNRLHRAGGTDRQPGDDDTDTEPPPELACAQRHVHEYLVAARRELSPEPYAVIVTGLIQECARHASRVLPSTAAHPATAVGLENAWLQSARSATEHRLPAVPGGLP